MKNNEEIVTAGKIFIFKPIIDKTIKKQAKKRESIIYGARALRAQMPLFLTRPTGDWDVFSKRPKRSARRLEKKLDKRFGDHFYVKPALYPGTHKVMARVPGPDLNIADYTEKPKGIKFVMINGIRYRTLGQEKKARRKSLKDKAYEFRHGKDRFDLASIKGARIMRRI